MAENAEAQEVTSPETTPAPAATAPEAPAAEAASATPEKPAAKRLGFFARHAAKDETIARLEGEVTEKDATIAALQADLESAQNRIAEFEALEAEFEAAEKEAQAAAQKAQAEAAAAAAQAEAAQTEAAEAKAKAESELPGKVAAGVTDAVASLGVPEGDLPEAKEDPPGPGQAGEFAHLKGRDRAVAAFNAQFGA